MWETTELARLRCLRYFWETCLRARETGSATGTYWYLLVLTGSVTGTYWFCLVMDISLHIRLLCFRVNIDASSATSYNGRLVQTTEHRILLSAPRGPTRLAPLQCRTPAGEIPRLAMIRGDALCGACLAW